jgi:uncharacterized Zn-binding protein involved in type VI secretion
MPPCSRITDNSQGMPHCHSVHPWSPVPHPNVGPIISGEPTVIVGNQPCARLTDQGTHAACCGPNTYKIISGSGTVIVGKKPCARIGDSTLHCGMASGKIIMGFATVIVGG